MDQPAPVPTEGRASLIDRLMALSDGLFAIAMTLLVLNIDVPELPPQRVDELAGDLAGLETKVYVWLLSFAVLAALWRHQHLVLDRFQTVDDVVVVLSFVLLASVTAVPFSSDLLGTYSDEPVATAVYAANIGLATLVLAATEAWGNRRGHVRSRSRGWDLALGLYLPVIFLGSIPIALVSADGAKYAWLASVGFIALQWMRNRPR